MYILCSNFDPDLAVSRVGEVLALEDSPERMAEKLGFAPDYPPLLKGIKTPDFKRLITGTEKIVKYYQMVQEIEKLKSGEGLEKFLGQGFVEKKVIKLEDEQRKLGSMMETPRWYYMQDRVWLVSAIRDYALDTSKNMEADWIDADEEEGSLITPLADMFMRGNEKLAKEIAHEMEKPLKDMDPTFILQQLDGHRSLVFNFGTNLVSYSEAVRQQ